MSRRARLVAMATAVALVCLPAAARAEVDGNELRRLCTSKGARENGLCYGYVTAIAEVARGDDGLYGHHACLPEHATRRQAVEVVKRFLDQHPEQRHYGASSLVAEALAEAFPCKQQPRAL
jgi:Rap1a immunity proteins